MSRRTAIFLVVFLVLWGLITHGTFAGSGDEPHYLIAAQSLAFDGDFDVANNYAAPHNLIAGAGLDPDAHARRGAGGVLRPAHDVGLPIVFAPYVRVVYPMAQALAERLPASWLRRARLDDILIFRHLISLAMAVIAGALAWQLFAIVRRVTLTDAAATFWALLVVLSPPILSVSFLFFTELPSALLIVWAFRTLTEPDERRPPWAMLGAATAFLLLLHMRNSAVVVGLLLWAAVRLRQMRAPTRDWTAWILGVSTMLMLRSVIVHLFWGTWLTTPMAVPGSTSMSLDAVARETFVRGSGLMFDQEFGLLVYAPIYVLIGPALLGSPARWLRGGWWALGLAAAYGLSVVVPYVNIHGWTGGWSPPARMIAPVVPLLAIIAVAWVVNARGAARVMIATLTVLQMAIDAIVWQWPKALWNYEDGTSALLASLPSVSRMLPSWNGPSPSAGRFVMFFAGWLAVSWLLARRSGPQGQRLKFKA